MAQTAFRDRFTIPTLEINDDITAAPNTRYQCVAVAKLEITLFANAAQNTVLGIQNIDGSGGFKIIQGAGVRIQVADQISTLGAAGYVESELDGATIMLVYNENQALWVMDYCSRIMTVA